MKQAEIIRTPEQKEAHTVYRASLKRDEIRDGIAMKLAFYACEDSWESLTSFKQQVYLDQALAIMEYQHSQGVVIESKEEAIFHHGYFPTIEPLIEEG